MALRIWLPLNGDLENKGISVIEFNQTGSPTVNAEGKIGSCYYFNGSSYFISKTNTYLTNMTECSFACWIKDTYTGSSYMRVFGVGTHKRAHLDITNTGKLRFFVSKNGTNNTFWGPIGTTDLRDSTWHHICGTFNNKECKVYVDGICEATVATNGLPTVTGGQFEIGHIQDGIKMTGYLNDLRMYDHCLSPLEVKEISQGLILHYKLDGWCGGIGENLAIDTANKINTSTGATKTVTLDYGLQSNFNLIRGKKITISADIILENALSTATSGWKRVGFESAIKYSDNTIQYMGYWIDLDANPKNSSGRYSTTVTVQDKDFLSIAQNGMYIQGLTSGTVTIKNIKVELGDKATPWTPSLSEMGADTTKIKDSSGYERDGTVSGTVTTEANESKDGRYLISSKFNENADSVTIPPCFSVGQTQTEMTTSIWAKTNTLNSTAPNLMSLGENSFWRFRLASASSVWWSIRVGSWTQRSARYSISGKNLLDNNWHYYAVTFKNGIVIFYVDGMQIGTTDCSDSATYITCNNVGSTWHLAGYNTISESFIGSLADARIYATALSAEDIATLYYTPAQIDNLGGIHGFEIIENKNDSIYKNGIIEHKMFIEPMQIEDGSLWVPICIHNIDGGNNMFATTDDFSVPVYHSCDLWANFPNIDLISRPETNYYEFLVKQQNTINGAWSTYRFKQTVNPLTATWATAGPSSGNVTWISGYTGTDCGGMYKLNSPTATSSNYMCFSNDSNGNWFGCGCKQVYQGGIPSICKTVPKGWQLVYMRADKYLYKNYKNGVTEATQFIEK